jgi:hypothetical protein
MRSTIIHVNRAHIAANAKDGGNRPVYTIKWGTGWGGPRTTYARDVTITGECKLVYDGTQLKCGARAWLEVLTGCIIPTDEMPFKEAKNAK